MLGFSSCTSSTSETSPTRPAVESPTRPAKSATVASTPGPVSPSARPEPQTTGVMLGIDVLAAQNFAPIAGKRVGLLTHPAGVNRFGVSTVEILHRAPNVKLVALYGPEHGVFGDYAASVNISDTVDKRTGLPAYSLFNYDKLKLIQKLKGLDALVIDLQDIGVRSYSFGVLMRKAMDACFEAGIEVVVLDRPNPLGGLKVDGPPLDRDLMSGVGAFQVPYVHGLTIGELARWAAGTPGGMDVAENVRLRGKLVVVPMRGWHRAMRWPETGLRFVPTSPYIPDFAACVGYSMTGLGCQLGGFTHGIGTQYPFRGLFYNGKTADMIQHDLEALRLPGLAFRKVATQKSNGQSAVGVYVEVIDWDDWRPTELSFYLMRLACQYSGSNPFAKASAAEALLFNKHMGSMDFFRALKRDGARTDIAQFISVWRQQNVLYQQHSRKFWLYD